MAVGLEGGAGQLEGVALGQLGAEALALHAGVGAVDAAQAVAEAIVDDLLTGHVEAADLVGGLAAERPDEVDGEADGAQDVGLDEGLAGLVAPDDDAQVGVLLGRHGIFAAVGAADVGPCAALVGRLLPLDGAVVMAVPCDAQRGAQSLLDVVGDGALLGVGGDGQQEEQQE